MGSRFAWVEFPDGRRIYTTLSTVVDCISSSLYEQFAEPGTRPSGEILDRPEPLGEPLAVRWDRPLSPPHAMIPVKVCIERDYAPWHALYCPSQRRVLPNAARNAEYLQEQVELVSQNGTLHLVPRVWTGEGYGYPGAEMASETLCGLAVKGEVIAFQRDRYDYGPGPHPEKPLPRDLYAEWDTGTVCKDCLVNPRALQAIEESTRYRAAQEPKDAASNPQRKSFWRRLFG